MASAAPLRIYVHSGGLARFCTVPYAAPRGANLGTACMHLTNTAVNRGSAAYVATGAAEDGGSKWSLATLLEALTAAGMSYICCCNFGCCCPGDSSVPSELVALCTDAHSSITIMTATILWLSNSVRSWLAGYDASSIWQQICSCVVKSLLLVHPVLAHAYTHAQAPSGHAATTISTAAPAAAAADTQGADESAAAAAARGAAPLAPNSADGVGAAALEAGSRCFELLGYDFMIDVNGKVWLLEVNHSPSFTVESPLDLEIKQGVLVDTLRLTRVSPAVMRRAEKVCAKFLIPTTIARQDPSFVGSVLQRLFCLLLPQHMMRRSIIAMPGTHCTPSYMM